MKTRITYAQLQQLLRKLKFVAKPAQPHCKAFEHPGTGLLIVWAVDRLTQTAREADVISTRIHLDRNGLLDAAEFDKHFGGPARRTRRAAIRELADDLRNKLAGRHHTDSVDLLREDRSR